MRIIHGTEVEKCWPYYQITSKLNTRNKTISSTCQRTFREVCIHKYITPWGYETSLWFPPFLCLPLYLLPITYWDRLQTLIAFIGEDRGANEWNCGSNTIVRGSSVIRHLKYLHATYMEPAELQSFRETAVKLIKMHTNMFPFILTTSKTTVFVLLSVWPGDESPADRLSDESSSLVVVFSWFTLHRNSQWADGNTTHTPPN